MRTLSAALALLAAASLARAEPVPVLFDTDMSTDCDDVGALAMLHALADRGECALLAVLTNSRDTTRASAAAVDAIDTYHGRPDIPIGTDKHSATRPPGTSSYAPALRDQFPNDIGPDDRAPDAVEVARKALAAQPDRSVTICSVGALSNLAELWKADPDLVRAKVARLVVMAGQFPTSPHPEWNAAIHPAATKLVAEQWPTEIVWHGFEVGQGIITGAALKQTPTNNPARRAYELKPFGNRPAIEGGQSSWDQGAVLYAVRGPQPELWCVVRGGTVKANDKGGTIWVANPAGRHAYVKLAAPPAQLAAVIEALMVAPPKQTPAQ